MFFCLQNEHGYKLYPGWQNGATNKLQYGFEISIVDFFVDENSTIQLFENSKIRTAWDEEQEEWYFSIVDVIGILTEQPDYDGARNYWKVMKKRLFDEGSELVTNCNQLKMKFLKDGKMWAVFCTGTCEYHASE